MLKENGFVILENVFDEDMLQTARKQLDQILQAEDSEANKRVLKNYFLGDRKDQGVLYDVYFRYPLFRRFTENDRILDAMQTVLGPNIMLYENSLISKIKSENNGVPWHQDFINRPDEPRKYIAWIAIDDVTVANGAMKYLPGSHKLGFLGFHQVKGETHHTRLNLDGVDVDKFEYLEMKAGDVLIFDQLLVHSSDKTDGSSHAPRRAYRFACQSLEMFYTPRCLPVVLRGGLPDTIPAEMADKTPDLAVTIAPTLKSRIKRKIKRVLAA